MSKIKKYENFNNEKSIDVYRFHNKKKNIDSSLIRGGTFYTPNNIDLDFFDKNSDNNIKGLGGNNKSEKTLYYKKAYIIKNKSGWLHQLLNKYNYLTNNYLNDLFDIEDTEIFEDIVFSKYDEDIIPIIKKENFIPNESKKIIINNLDDTNKIYASFDFLISNALKRQGYDILFIKDENDVIKEIFHINN